jgi:hypothetical protein
VDPERWPQAVRLVVDQIGYQVGSETVVEVHELLVDDGQHYGWLITSPSFAVRFQVLGHEPEPAPTTVPLPAWVAKLNDLPPGGTQ